MWNDPPGDTRSGGDVVQRSAESAQQHFAPTRPGQKEAIGRCRVDRAKEAEALDQLADKRIHRNHAFGFHLAERYMNCPFIWSAGVEECGPTFDCSKDP
jgi:hypothetical protein